MITMATQSTLGELLAALRKLDNLSGQDVSDRAARRGFKISKQTISDFETKKLTSINGPMIRALAAGLGVSERRVASAALMSLGVDPGNESAPLRQAILDSTEVGERTKRTLLAILAAEENERELEATVTKAELELAARKPPPDGSRGRQARRAQDEDATGSQDPEGPELGV